MLLKNIPRQNSNTSSTPSTNSNQNLTTAAMTETEADTEVTKPTTSSKLDENHQNKQTINPSFVGHTAHAATPEKIYKNTSENHKKSATFQYMMNVSQLN